MSKTKVLSGMAQDFIPREENLDDTGMVRGQVFMTEIPADLVSDMEFQTLFLGFLKTLGDKGWPLRLKIPNAGLMPEGYKEQIKGIPNIQVVDLEVSRLVKTSLSPSMESQASSASTGSQYSSYHESLARSQNYLEQFERDFKDFEEVAEFSKKVVQVISGLINDTSGDMECPEMTWEEVGGPNT